MRLRHPGPPIHLITVRNLDSLKKSTLHETLVEVAIMRGRTVEALAELMPWGSEVEGSHIQRGEARLERPAAGRLQRRRCESSAQGKPLLVKGGTMKRTSKQTEAPTNRAAELLPEYKFDYSKAKPNRFRVHA